MILRSIQGNLKDTRMRNIPALIGALLLVLLVGCGKETEQSSQQDSRPDVAVDTTQGASDVGGTASEGSNIPDSGSTAEDTMNSDNEDKIDDSQDVVVNTD
jgi:hypothetical protein